MGPYGHLQMFLKFSNIFVRCYRVTSVFARLLWYFDFEELTIFDITSVRAFKDV